MPLIELSNESIRVVLDPTNGCVFSSLELCNDGRWHPVLGSSGDGAGCFAMVPWTNRIKAGCFEFGGLMHQLKPNHPDGSSIHGVVRDHAWDILDRSPYSARCAFDSRNAERVNYPFAFGALMRVEIGDSVVEIDLELTNLDTEPMPGGVGHHPYFLRKLWDEGDELSIKAGVSGRYPCQGQIPNSAMRDDAVCRGLRDGGPIGNPGLDDVFGGFDGEAELIWNKSGVRCRLVCSESFGHLVLYTPTQSANPPPLLAMPWVCVEPMTMVTNGLNSLTEDSKSGVRILEPGETLSTRLSMSFESLELDDHEADL